MTTTSPSRPNQKSLDMDPFKFTSERDLELSANLGQLGIFNFVAKKTPGVGGHLLDSRQDTDFEHRQDFLNDTVRQRVLDDLESWRARKRVKTLLKKRMKDQLFEYVEHLRNRTRLDETAERFLTTLANVDDSRLVDFAEMHGILDLVNKRDTGVKQDEYRRIQHVCSRTADQAKRLQSWFRLFDDICEKRIPLPRATWAIKAHILLHEKSRIEIPLSHHPKWFADYLMQWMLFTLAEPPKASAGPQNGGVSGAPMTASNIRKTQISPTMDGPLNGKNSPSLRERSDKWRRGASLVRWMFEDGLLKDVIVFEEYLKMLRLVFGAMPETQQPAPTHPYPAMHRTVQNTAPLGTATLLANFKVSDKMQMLVLSEVASYVPDAAKTGFAKEFVETFRLLLKQSALQQMSQAVSLVNKCVDLCELSLPPAAEMSGTENVVDLTWELQNLKTTKSVERLASMIWEALLRNGYYDPLRACVTLLHWASTSLEEDAEDHAYLACLGIEDAFQKKLVDVRTVFDSFVSENEERLTEKQMEIASWTLSFLLDRSVKVDLSISTSCFRGGDGGGQHSSLKRRTFLNILARSEYAPIGCRNAVGLGPQEDSWREFLRTALNCEFKLEQSQVVSELLQIKSPSQRLKVLIVVIERVPMCTLVAGLIPFLENSLIYRHILSEINSSSSDQDMDELFSSESVTRKLRLVLEQRRESGGGELEAMARLKELLDSQLVSNQSNAGSISTTNPEMYPGPMSNRQRRVGGASHLALAGVLSDDNRNKLSPPENAMASGVGGLPQVNQAGIRSLPVEGFDGEEARFQEGISLLGEGVEKICNLVWKHVQNKNLGMKRLFAFLRDLFACRNRRDREKICAWCITSLDASEGLDKAIEYGLLRIEDVMNRWHSKRFIPSKEALDDLAHSPIAASQIRSHDPSVVKYAWFLVSQQTNEEDIAAGGKDNSVGSEFIQVFSRSWIARGPTIFEQPVNVVSDLIEALQKQMKAATTVNNNNNNATIMRNGDKDDGMFLLEVEQEMNPCELAQRDWFSYPGSDNKQKLAKSIVEMTKNWGDKSAMIGSALAMACKVQEEICNVAKNLGLLSPANLDASVVNLVSRCIPAASEETRKAFVEMCSEWAFRTSDSRVEELALSILSAAISRPKSIQPELAMKILGHIRPLQNKKLTIHLARNCEAPQRRTLFALVMSWRSFWPEHADFFSRVLRICDSDSIPMQHPERESAENMIVCGEPVVPFMEMKLVDAWSMLEGARESDANYEFLKSAVVRSSARS